MTFSHLAQHFYFGLSVLYPEIMADLNLNYTQLGIVTGTSSIIAGFLQMMWSLLNRYVSKRILLGIGNILMSVGSVVMGGARQFIELMSGNIVGGSGQAAQHPVGTSIITHKFSSTKVPWALSLHYGLGYVGNIISPVLLSSIAVFLDWRHAMLVLAMIPFITGLVVLYFLRNEQSASRSIQRGESSNLLQDIRSALHMRSVLIIIAVQAFAVGGTGMGVIITYTPLFLKNMLNLGSLDASLIYSLSVVGGVSGTLLFGHLAKKVGPLKIAAAIVGTCSLLILLLTFHTSFNVLLIPHLFLVGFTSFAGPSLLQAHLASISTSRHRDVLLGLFFTIGFGVSSIWTALTGFLIDIYGSFTPAWLLRTILGSIAFTLILLASHQTREPTL